MPPDSAADSLALPPDAALSARYGTPVGGPVAWNATLALLLAHRSVRAYLPEKIPAATQELIIAAAQSASTSSNLQVWSVVAVEDPARKARLAGFAGQQKHVEQAPLLLVWLADLSRAERIGEAAGQSMTGVDYTESFIVALVDAALAAQNAVVAAESLGLATCYIGALRNKPEAVAAELGLPPKVVAVFGLLVGRPDPDGESMVKPRLPQSVVVHREAYGTAAEAAGIAAYDERLTRFQEKTRMKPVGWTRSILSRLHDGAALLGRDRIRETLRAMGFELR